MKCMIFVKASTDSEQGAMPAPELIAAMGKYNEELFKAGVSYHRPSMSRADRQRCQDK